MSEKPLSTFKKKNFLEQAGNSHSPRAKHQSSLESGRFVRKRGSVGGTISWAGQQFAQRQGLTSTGHLESSQWKKAADETTSTLEGAGIWVLT